MKHTLIFRSYVMTRLACSHFAQHSLVSLARRAFCVGIAVVSLAAGTLHAAGVVVTVKTGDREVVIQTDDPELEIVSLKGGELIRIRDTGSGQSWRLDPEKYEISMADKPDGRTIRPDDSNAIVLKRNGKTLVTVTRRKVAARDGRAQAPTTIAQPVGDRSKATGDNAAAAWFVVRPAAEVRRALWNVLWNNNPNFPVHSWVTAFSPDGRYYLAGGDSGSVQFFDVKSGAQIQDFKHGAYVNCAVFTPDSKQLLSGGDDKLLKLWNVETGEQVRAMEGHQDAIDSVDITPDGRFAVTGGRDMTLRLWDVATGREVRKFDQNSGGVFTRDGKQILSWSGNNDGESILRLRDVETGQEVRKFEGHTAGVVRAFVLGDGKRVLSYSFDSTVRIWDLATAKEESQFNFGLNNAYEFPGVTPSPNGRYLLIADANRAGRIIEPPRVRVINMESWEEVHRFECPTSPKGLSFSPDSSLAAAGSWRGFVYLWQMPRTVSAEPGTVSAEANPPAATNQLLVKIRQQFETSGPKQSPDGTIGLKADGLSAQLYDVESKKNIGKPLQHSDPNKKPRRLLRKGTSISNWAFSDDGKMVAIAISWHDGDAFDDPHGALAVWDVNTQELVPVTFGKGPSFLGPVHKMIFTPDGRTLLVDCEFPSGK